MEMGLFQGRELGALLHQDDSTSLWPRTSVVSSQKPLFLKELDKLWRRLPHHNAGTTVLLDNHVEKFERNPEHCGIVVQEWKVSATTQQQQQQQQPEEGDCALALDGELVVATTQQQQQQQQPEEGDCALALDGELVRLLCARAGLPFPPVAEELKTAAAAARNTNQPPNATTLVRSSREQPPPPPPQQPQQSQQQHQHQQQTPHWATSERSVVAELLKEFCSSKVHCELNPAHCDWRKYFEGHNSPGPRSLPFRRAHLAGNLGARPYLVGEKSDGERRLLFAKGGHAFLVDVRGGRATPLPQPLTKAFNFNVNGNHSNHDDNESGAQLTTILDGELVANQPFAHGGGGGGGVVLPSTESAAGAESA
eukprot:CAMPEP_0171989722 /NCGR_PEP_ID=MMETSP0993-20121228/276557_1 /TAXON_ID=483369 /ORGANISM="non described non described, Strain CCMP2098" /LENGTH=366 /DNA_ID=CAMNT_0012642715 /DNA_START=79 /DNA_END=1176 /DNA_ORIENTATION=-